ncbi:hypothetical protein Dimus_029034, partial [Dionaea muscipula]
GGRRAAAPLPCGPLAMHHVAGRVCPMLALGLGCPQPMASRMGGAHAYEAIGRDASAHARSEQATRPVAGGCVSWLLLDSRPHNNARARAPLAAAMAIALLHCSPLRCSPKEVYWSHAQASLLA